MATAEAPVPSRSAGPIREPLPTWDRRTWLVAIPLALIVIAAFIPTLHNRFVVGWDDDRNFLDNPYFRGLGAAQGKWAWTTFWLGAYQPLAWFRAFWTSSCPPSGWLAGSFLLFVAGMLFKAVVTLPAVLLIPDVYPLQRFGDGPGRWLGASAPRALLAKVPFVMTSLFFTGLAITAKPQSRFPGILMRFTT